MTGFSGFGPDLADFYTALAAENTREWFRAHRDVYDEQVARPLHALAEALTAEFGPVKAFRPYRDVRFSSDKRPIQEHASFAAGDGESGLLYFQIDADEVLVAGGWYQPGREQLLAFRRAIDDPAVAADCHQVLDRLARKGLVLGEGGDSLKTAPRGWSTDHPEIGLLRRTSLAVSERIPLPDWAFSKRCVTELTRRWRDIRTWCDWLAEQAR